MQKSFRYWNIFVTESFGLSAGERRQLGRVLRLEIATCRTLPMTTMMAMLKADRITKYIDAEKAHNWLKEAVKRQRAKWVTCYLISLAKVTRTDYAVVVVIYTLVISVYGFFHCFVYSYSKWHFTGWRLVCTTMKTTMILPTRMTMTITVSAPVFLLRLYAGPFVTSLVCCNLISWFEQNLCSSMQY